MITKYFSAIIEESNLRICISRYSPSFAREICPDVETDGVAVKMKELFDKHIL